MGEMVAARYGAHATGCAGAGRSATAPSAGDQAELKDAPAGGPGSSSAPGARCQQLHPEAGPDRTRQQPGREHSAAVPWAVMPAKALQCQHGRGVPGVECMPPMMTGGWLAG